MTMTWKLSIHSFLDSKVRKSKRRTSSAKRKLSYVVEETDVEEDSLGGRGTGSKSGAV
jgi:hypothetical protein